MTPEQFDAFNFGMGPGNTPAASQSGNTNLTVNLQGGINVGSTYEFYQTVQTALQELNRAGNSLTSAGN